MDMATKNMVSVQFLPEEKGEYTFLRDMRKLVGKLASVYQREEIESNEFMVEIQLFSNEPTAIIKQTIIPYLLNTGLAFKMNIFDSETMKDDGRPTVTKDEPVPGREGPGPETSE